MEVLLTLLHLIATLAAHFIAHWIAIILTLCSDSKAAIIAACAIEEAVALAAHCDEASRV